MPLVPSRRVGGLLSSPRGLDLSPRRPVLGLQDVRSFLRTAPDYTFPNTGQRRKCLAAFELPTGGLGGHHTANETAALEKGSRSPRKALGERVPCKVRSR